MLQNDDLRSLDFSSSNKKLLGAPGIAARLLGARTLLGTTGIATNGASSYS